MAIARKLKEIFGYDRKKLGWYRDLALGLTAGMSLLYGIVFGSEAWSGRGSSFDLKISIGCFVIIMLCVLVSPHKKTVLIFAVVAPVALMLHGLGKRKPGVAFFLVIFLFLLAIAVGVADGLIQLYRRKRVNKRFPTAQVNRRRG